MNELLIFTALLWIIAAPASFIVLKLLFKKSVLVTFGLIWLVAQGVLINLAYEVGRIGNLIDFLWAFPMGMSFIVAGYISE